MSALGIVQKWEYPSEPCESGHSCKQTCFAVPPYITKKINPETYEHTIALTQERKVAALNPERTLALHEPKKTITIFNAHGKPRLPGDLIYRKEFAKPDNRSKTFPVSDQSAKELWDISMNIYDYWLKVHQRKSYGNHNEEMKAVAHYSDNPKRGFDNAFWNGRFYVSGDGDLFKRMSSSPTVGYHEWTHAVIGDLLIYDKQAGALNEALADIFAILCDMFTKNQTVDQNKWLIGDELIDDSKLKGIQALRSLIMPGTAYDTPELGKDPQPSDMSGFVVTKEDDGGVHYNSGIINRAFYLMAKEVSDKAGNDPSAVFAWNNVGHIWFDALMSTRPDSTFLQFAEHTIDIAKKKFGENSREHTAALNAWTTVKVLGFKPVTT